MTQHAESLGRALNPPQAVSYEYGPKEAVQAATVQELFHTLGAPYEVYQVGDRTYYRWGAGKSAVEGEKGTVERNEFLVAAASDGKVIESTYLNKVRAVGTAGFLVDADMP